MLKYLLILFITQQLIYCQYQGKYPYHDCDFELEIDGKNYFESIYQAIKSAQKEVFIIGWKIIPEEVIHDKFKTTEVTLKQSLLDAKNRGVKVYVMFWKNAILNFLNLDMMAMRFNQGAEILKEIGINVLIDDGRGYLPNVRWSQHQKFVVVDRKIGFMGGIDLASSRYDTNDHNYFDKQRTDHSDELNHFDEPKLYGPWHDLHVKVDGKVVIDMAQSFIQRWTSLCDDKWLPYDGCEKEKQPAIILNIEQNFEDRDTADTCQLTRSCSYFLCGNKDVETDIYKSIEWTINNAQNYLYFENQYVISSDFAQNNVKNLIMNRVKEKILNQQKFKVFIVVPFACTELNLNIVNYEQLYYNDDSFYNQFINFLQEIKISNSYSEQQKQYATLIQFTDYISINSLFSVQAEKEHQGVQSIFLHSKVVIADDKWASVGSANWNDRSYLGDRDSELNIFFAQKNEAKAGFAKRLRQQLMKEHLGLNDDSDWLTILDNPISDEFYYQIWRRVGLKNQNILKEIFKFDAEKVNLDLDFNKVFYESVAENEEMSEENLNILKTYQGHIFAQPEKPWSKNREKYPLVNWLNQLPFISGGIEI